MVSMSRNRSRAVATNSSHAGTGKASGTRRRQSATLRDMIRDAIVDAFYAAHDGYSIDWLLANPQLQAAFHEAAAKRA